MEATLRFRYASDEQQEIKECTISSGDGFCFSETLHFLNTPNRAEVIIPDYPAIIYVARVFMEQHREPVVETSGDEISTNLFVNTTQGSKLTIYFSKVEPNSSKEKKKESEEYEFYLKLYVFPLEDTKHDRDEILCLVERNQNAKMKKEEALALVQMKYAEELEKQERIPSAKELLKLSGRKLKNKLKH